MISTNNDMLLFEETSLANLTIKNKIFRAATSETAANENGDITENLIDFYTKLARGGTGLMIFFFYRRED